jgi:hypothetical protein
MTDPRLQRMGRVRVVNPAELNATLDPAAAWSAHLSATLADFRRDLEAGGLEAVEPAEFRIEVLAWVQPRTAPADCTAVGFTGEGRCIEPAGPSGLCPDHEARS